MFESSDLAIVAAAAGLAAGAGLLQYTVSSGEKGLNAFLMKEKATNPFYSKNFRAEKPSPPKWLSGLRLPALDFVETYGDAKPLFGIGNSGSNGESNAADGGTLMALYKELDDAVEQEDYTAAREAKAKIDAVRADTGSGDDIGR